MRKLILITAMVLISASAQAGATRGLTIAANDEQPAAAEAPNAAEEPKTDAPKFVERPAAVVAPADAPKADRVEPASDEKAEKPRHKRESTEARVIYELHRHGIYW